MITQLNPTAETLPARPALSARLGPVLRQQWAAALGGVIFLVVVVCALGAPWISPYDPLTQNVPQRLQLPSATYWLGTDDFGRDMFSRIVWGARPVLISGLSSVLLAMLVGGGIGLISGYFGGWLDDIVMRIVDVVLSFPVMLLAILIVAGLGPGLTNAVIAISFAQMPVFARQVRALVLTVTRNDYIEAARALGVPSSRVMLRHVLPNLIGPVIVQATATLALAIGYAAALSFLGLGVPSGTPDWGAMVSDTRRLIFTNPLVPFIPGAAITITVMALNFLGDGLRDWLDPTA